MYRSKPYSHTLPIPALGIKLLIFVSPSCFTARMHVFSHIPTPPANIYILLFLLYRWRTKIHLSQLWGHLFCPVTSSWIYYLSSKWDSKRGRKESGVLETQVLSCPFFLSAVHLGHGIECKVKCNTASGLSLFSSQSFNLHSIIFPFSPPPFAFPMDSLLSFSTQFKMAVLPGRSCILPYQCNLACW